MSPGSIVHHDYRRRKKAGVGPRLVSAGPSSQPRLATRRRTVLLAMGFYTHARHVGIARYAREAGWVLDCRLLAFRSSPPRHLAYLGGGRYDGVLAYLSSETPKLRAIVAGLRVPVVDLGLDYPELPYPRVVPDNVAIGRMAAEHLLERGFRELVFYTHSYDTDATRARHAGFARRAATAGAKVELIVWDRRSGPGSSRDRLGWLAAELARRATPLGLVAINDHVAVEAVEACAIAGLRVPEQVAVLGVDNDELVVETGAIPVSSVDSDRERVGYEAARLLDRLIAGRRPPRRPVLIPPAGIVVRKSTDVLAIADPNVAVAMHYIWEHFREPISVASVAARTLLSRRRLQDAFAKHVGRTIAQEITLHRVNYARRLLSETDRKAYLIAREAGFGTGERMSKVFARLLGTTPRTYRRKTAAAR